MKPMWATERKHLPDKDVAAAGGWRDVESLRKSYQQVDEKTLLQVMTNPNRLLDIDVKPKQDRNNCPFTRKSHGPYSQQILIVIS